MGRGSYFILLALTVCLFVHASFGLVQESVPESGSTLAGNEGENINIMCTLLREAGGPQRITEWFIDRGSGPALILSTDPNFVIVGERVSNTTDFTYRTNFTILRLTSDLDRVTIYCGLGGNPVRLAANFTLRIYRPPSLVNQAVTAVEGGIVTTIPLGQAPEAFPFPQLFQWTRNGMVVTNGTRVTYGYPGITFQFFSREDSGTYNLTATNYRLDDTSVVVGTDMVSFTLDVQFPPDIAPPGDTQRAVLEGGDITLVCGSSVDGNPTPTISWTDNNGTAVSDGPGISGSNTLMLAITSVTRSHTGNWTCSVENSVSNIDRQIVLVVVVSPSQPTDVAIQSVDIGPTYARVCWQAPLFLGVPELSRYQVTATPVGGGTSVTAGTTDSSRDLNVTGLAPGTNYQFQVMAISEFGSVTGSSSQSEPGFANTTFTVPAPSCQGTPSSAGGVITVRWDYIHRGGLDLTRVVITATKGVESAQLDVPNGNLTDLSLMSLGVATFTAGFEYTFTVTAYNRIGPGTAVCDRVTHLIGIPRTPDPPVGVSDTPGVVLLTLSTPESGTTPPQMFLFVVNVVLASSGTTISRTLEANDFMDAQARQFAIDGLMAGGVYLFSAQAQNEFGSSDFSGNSQRVQVATMDTATPPTGTTGTVTPQPAEPLVLNFINNSPRVQGNNISVDVQTSRPVLTFLCALTGQPTKDCSSGSTTFTNIPPRANDRPYILRVVAITSDRVKTVLRRAIRMELPNICTVHLINDGVTISGNSATVEFDSTGPSNAFLCNLDRQGLVSCSSGQVFSGLSSGEHRLKIVPDNCGRNRHSLVVRFTVDG